MKKPEISLFCEFCVVTDTFSNENLNKYTCNKWINLNIVLSQGKYILKKLSLLTGEKRIIPMQCPVTIIF